VTQADDAPLNETFTGDMAGEESLENQTVTVASHRLAFSFAKRHQVLLTYPLKMVAEQDNGSDDKMLDESQPLTLFYTPTTALSQLLEIRRHFELTLPLKCINEDAFEELLLLAYQHNSSKAQQMMENIGNEVDLFSLAEELPKTEDLLDAEDDAPIIKLINALLAEAIKEEASDIHIETYEQQLLVRFRIDGQLKEVLRPHRKLASVLVSRIKVMAKLDIAEKRVPQDGRISLRIGGRAVDVRVSTMPSTHGERVVLRLLDKNAGRMNLAQLGMSPGVGDSFAHLIRRPHGIILVTGPTGSGKSTTLYAGLNDINTSDRNILTVEDPVEYELVGIGQTQVNTKVDMTFARGLRAILRQDPDVVMIGEIRDLETAQIAVQASLTGHLVLSTLHTNTAIGAVMRLQDMGVEPFMISSSLLGVIAQRLVRILCSDCKVPAQLDAEEKKMMGLLPDFNETIYRAEGCEACGMSGYRGRMGIHEFLTVTDEVRQLIHADEGEVAIEQVVRQTSPSIRQDGFSKVLRGETTVEEVVRVTRED
jgi:general secretion pathway protein E